jgi:lipopolysaccharide export system protein LptA
MSNYRFNTRPAKRPMGVGRDSRRLSLGTRLLSRYGHFGHFPESGRFWKLPAVIFFSLLLSAAGATALEDPPNALSEPIRIVADRLVTDSNAQRAEFSGNVTASQGETQMTSDRLVIFYSGSGQPENVQESIQRIEAYGNVRIHLEDRVATTEKAIYTTTDRKLILTGQGSKITRGQDEITGNEIIFDRDRQTVNVESRGQGQVNAVIHSDQRGLN